MGIREGGLWLYALASRDAGLQIENPRQHYLRQYGPQSPSFSRAILKSQRDMQTLMRYYWDTIEHCVPPEIIIQAMRNAGFHEAGCEAQFDLFRAYCGRKLPLQPGD